MSKLIESVVASNAGWAGLVLRVPTAAIFIGHGAQKLFAWFGGYGLAGTGQWMESIGLDIMTPHEVLTSCFVG